MAELDTMDTPMIACRLRRYSSGLSVNCIYDLYCTAPGHGAPGVSEDRLPDELIHHVGKVGDDEDGHYGQGQVGGLHLGSREVAAVDTSW